MSIGFFVVYLFDFELAFFWTSRGLFTALLFSLYVTPCLLFLSDGSHFFNDGYLYCKLFCKYFLGGDTGEHWRFFPDINFGFTHVFSFP